MFKSSHASKLITVILFFCGLILTICWFVDQFYGKMLYVFLNFLNTFRSSV